MTRDYRALTSWPLGFLRRAAELPLFQWLLFAAYVACLGVMFFTDPDVPTRPILYFFFLPLAILSLFAAESARLIRSTVLLACIAYLTVMVVASMAQADASAHLVWRQARLSVAIIIFLSATGILVARGAGPQLVLVVGSLLTVSAALNIALFLSQPIPAISLSQVSARLIATIGMPGYTNSTNISATYVVFFAGMVGILVQARTARWTRVVALCGAAVLAAGVLLTQARSAYVAVIATLVTVGVTSSRRVRIAVGAVAAGVLALAILRPDFRDAIVARGTGQRFHVWSGFWSLIMERPFLGYGSFDTTTGVLDDGVLRDQAHNLVLSAWFRGGVASAAAMFAILAAGLYWANRYRAATGQMVPLCMIVAIATAGMFDYQLLVTYPTWPWVTFWLPFGLCIGAEISARGSPAFDPQSRPGH